MPPGIFFKAKILVAFAVLPGAAWGHASERMVVLTLPTGPFLIAAWAAVFLTAVAGVMADRLPGFGWRRVMGWPGGGVLGSWVGFFLLAGLLAVGVWGSRDPLANLLPLAVWTGLWVGLVLASALLGDLWRPVAPWRGPVRAARAMLGWRGSVGLGRLGVWPAVLGMLGFAWFEIVSLAPDDPLVLARVVGVYWLAVFVAAVAEGEDWLDRGEFLTVAFGVISKVAPVWRAEGELRAGLPGAQVVAMRGLTAGEVAFVTLLIGAVSFDGLADTFAWLGFVGVNPLEFPGRSAVVVVNTAGLLAVWTVVAVTVAGVLALGAGRAVVLSFVPIAAGYHLAHYLVALLVQGQYAVAALNDPFGRGWALLGLPEHWVGFGFLSDRGAVWAIWGVQFALILGAHLLAVVLSLKMAAGGWRVHLPLGVLMAGYTVFGLWLLSAAAAG